MSKRQQLTQTERLVSSLKIGGETGQQEHANSSQLLTRYLVQNEKKIIQDLQHKDNEALFKKFYHIRWLQISGAKKDMDSLSKLYKSLMNSLIGDGRSSFGPEQALLVLIHLSIGLGRIIREFCDFVAHVIDQKVKTVSHKKEKYTHLLKLYSQFWSSYSVSIVNID